MRLAALFTAGAILIGVPAARAQTPVDLDVQVGGTPGSTTVSWQSANGASQYTVQRYRADQSTCCRNASPVLTSNSWTDAPLVQPGNYVYRVTVRFFDGHLGFSEKRYTRPTPVSPSGFAAVQQANGAVLLSWEPVPSAVYYVLEEPATRSSGTQQVTGKLLGILAPGQHTWLVSTCYSQPPQPICSDQTPARVTFDVKPVIARHSDPGSPYGGAR